MKSIKATIRIIKKLNYILTPKQKQKSFYVLFIIVISSIFELLGITAILPFIQAVLLPDKLMKNKTVMTIANFLGIGTSNGLLVLMGIFLIFIYILKNLYMIFSIYTQYDFSTRIQKELSIKMLNSYMSRPYEYFLDVNSAEILRGCTNDIGSVYLIISYFFTMISEILTVTMIGIFLIYTDPIIAIGIILLLLVMLGGIVIVFKPYVKRAGKKNVEALSQKNRTIYQAITGIKEISVMQRKEYFVKEYGTVSEVVRKLQRRYECISNSPDRIIEGICVSGLIGIVCIRLALESNMLEFVPKLSVFAMAAFKILPSIGKITNRITSIIFNQPALENVYENMKEVEEYEKQKKKYIIENSHMDLEREKITFENSVLINHIQWQYNNQRKPVLADVELRINKGEAVALIGSSGAGKTTLADIVLGLLKPRKGTIEMDGIDVYTMQEAWARIIGYVPQNVFLIDDTVRNNIAFGIDKNNIDDEFIWKALEQAQIKEFIKNLPKGLDTEVGERGIKFSGGQKQRIAIARALYSRPEILVLDEATAALDNETESAVMESIEMLQGKITLIIVAHRLTTIKNCDVIYEIKAGTAVKRDKYEVLKGII